MAFFMPASADSLRAGLALKRTVAPAFTATFSPVCGFSAVRLAVSRTLKTPKSWMVKRPDSTILALIAQMMSAAVTASPPSSEASRRSDAGEVAAVKQASLTLAALQASRDAVERASASL